MTAHALTIAPIKFAVGLIEVELFGRERAAFGDDGFSVAPVEIDALDRTVVLLWVAHIRPVDVARFYVNDDAVGNSASAHDGLRVGAVGVCRENSTGTGGVEYEQAFASCFLAGCALRFLSL